MNRAEMLALLAKSGIVPATTATDADLKALVIGTLTEKVAAPGMTSAEVAAIVAKALEPIAAQLAKKATNNMGDAPGLEGERPVTSGQKHSTEGTGLSMARIVKAVAKSALEQKTGNFVTPLQVLQAQAKKDSGYDMVAKSFLASSLSDGGSMVPEVFATEIIELLRNTTVMRVAGYRQVPLEKDNLTIGRQTSAATAQYGAEGAPITTSKPGTDQVKLSAKKLTTLCPVSNDIIRIMAPAADAFVRDDLIKVMKIREDLAFLRGDGTVDTPKGIRNDMAAANAYAATAVAPKVPTLQEVRTELAKIRYQLRKNNVDMSKLQWVSGPRTEFFLTQLQDGNGNPAIFAKDIASGTLWGIPFAASIQVPENLGGASDESELYLYNPDEFMIGDAMMMELTVDPNGTYEESGVVKSGMSRDETPVRIISKHDCKLRHNVSAACVTALRWGAP